jgi:hypothetical protein
VLHGFAVIDSKSLESLGIASQCVAIACNMLQRQHIDLIEENLVAEEGLEPPTRGL